MNVYNFEANIAGKEYYFSVDAPSEEKAFDSAKDFCFTKAEKQYSFIDFLKGLSGEEIFSTSEKELHQKWKEVQSKVIKLRLAGFNI